MTSEIATRLQSTTGETSTGRLSLRGAPINHDLRVTPIMASSGSVFGAQVDGVDWSEPLAQSTVDDLVALQDQYAVLIFRNTGLDNKRHIHFASQLGKKLEVNPFYAGIENDRLQEPYLWDVGNIEKDGSLVQPDSRRWHHSLGNALWHTDSSYHQERSKYSLLLAHGQVSAGQSSTHFADTRRAYAELPEQKKKELEGLIVEHDLWHSRKLASPLVYAEPTAAERAKKPPAFHKLVQPAPNGEPTLYIAAHSKAIVGWSQEDSDRLIKELIDWCTQPQYVFTMDWVNSGDMVWWDNRASMHRANPYTVDMSARDVRRATVIDDGPHAWGVEPNKQ